MSAFNHPGECAMCPRIFTMRAAQLGQGLNAQDLCSGCARRLREAAASKREHERLAKAGAGLGAC